MENIKYEKKEEGNITTISTLVTKREMVRKKSFVYEKKTPEIKIIATYLEESENGIKKIKVIGNL